MYPIYFFNTLSLCYLAWIFSAHYSKLQKNSLGNISLSITNCYTSEITFLYCYAIVQQCRVKACSHLHKCSIFKFNQSVKQKYSCYTSYFGTQTVSFCF